MISLSLGEIDLRQIRIEEIELIRDWRNSPDIAKYMYSEDHISREQQISWYNRILKDQFSVYWMIEYKGSQVGVANITNINKRDMRCDWAFYLGSPEIRGKGIGSRVEFLIIDYVFKTLELHKICCEVFSFNESVIQQHIKFGFKVEGTRRNHIRKNGTFFDIIEMGLLKDEWDVVSNVQFKKLSGST